MENSYHRLSKLNIKCQKGQERDYLSELSFTAPFKITKPFYNENDHMTVMVLSVSAGIMAGDEQEIDVIVEKNSAMTVTSQSFEKIHKMAQNSSASRKTKLEVKSGGYLNYSPLPTIPFADSAFDSATEIRLEDKTSKLVYSEIISCGRAGCGEVFAYHHYKSLTKIWVAGELIYFDNANYQPKMLDMSGLCMFEGYTHLANILLINLGDEDEKIEKIREIIAEDKEISAGATKLSSGDICLRILANESDKLINIGKKLLHL